MNIIDILKKKISNTAFSKHETLLFIYHKAFKKIIRGDGLFAIIR